ncbi:MAG: membrane protein insertase YidC [Streptococcaceae bacterium]|jgi:YidC/Oxa1 family membrane protein insertase|nr:membrane protein insertase YidC [Streptococcaceae bacterium]
MKNLKRLMLVASSFVALFMLAGCATYEKGTQIPVHNWYYWVLIRPGAAVIDLFAKQPLTLGFGWAIVVVTLIVRVFILPLGLRQQYKSTYMQEKMAYLAPVFQPINDRLKAAREARDQPAMMAAQQQLVQAQKDNGINMLSSMGCLPMLIQWPFFILLYNAARYTDGIASASFYGIDLGKPSVFLTLAAGVFYLIQTWVIMQGMTEEQKKAPGGTTMLWMSPVMIIVFSFMSPAGVTLYWVVGGLVVLIQQLIVTYYMKPRMRVAIDEEFAKNPPVMKDLPKDVTPVVAKTDGLDELISGVRGSLTEGTAADENPVSADKKDKAGAGRNAGKQNKKK